MMRSRVAFILFVFLAGVTALAAKDFWTESYDRWSRKQVDTILTDSPWARSQMLTSPIDSKDAGLQGEKETVETLTVRFFSALPVREAYVRMMQLMNNYDEMGANQQQQFNTRFERALKLDVSDRVIVAVEFSSNVPDMNRDTQQFFRNATTDTLSQNVYLITQHQGRVKLQQYFPPSPDGTGAKFVFPRKVNGQEVIQPGDDNVTFEIYFPPVNDTYRLQFKVGRMLYRDAVAY